MPAEVAKAVDEASMPRERTRECSRAGRGNNGRVRGMRDDTRIDTPPGIRYASDERFRAAQRKTSALHAGLFRRLAE